MNPLVYDCIPWLGHARIPDKTALYRWQRRLQPFVSLWILRRMSERHVRHPELVGMSNYRTYDLLPVPIVSGISTAKQSWGSPVETPTSNLFALRGGIPGYRCDALSSSDMDSVFGFFLFPLIKVSCFLQFGSSSCPRFPRG